MGWFEVKTPPTAGLVPSIEVDICPRTILRRVTEYVVVTLNSSQNVTVLIIMSLYQKRQKKFGCRVSCELRIEIHHDSPQNTNPIEAINNHGWSILQAFASGTTGAQVLEEIADALALANIELQQYHSGCRCLYTHPRNNIQYSH